MYSLACVCHWDWCPSVTYCCCWVFFLKEVGKVRHNKTTRAEKSEEEDCCWVFERVQNLGRNQGERLLLGFFWKSGPKSRGGGNRGGRLVVGVLSRARGKLGLENKVRRRGKRKIDCWWVLFQEVGNLGTKQQVRIREKDDGCCWGF